MKTNSGPKHVVAIFNVIAISHLLQGRLKPFDERETEPRKYKWTTDNIKEFDFLKALRQTFGSMAPPKYSI